MDIASNDTDAEGAVVKSTITITDQVNGTAKLNADGTVDFHSRWQRNNNW